MKKIGVAIIGPGNIGIDLIYKITRRSEFLDLKLVLSRRKESKGLKIARELNIETAYGDDGINKIIENDDIKIVFDATSASAHFKNAPLLMEAGKRLIDLTPAAIGPYVAPVVNLKEHIKAPNINLITCGGQATIPIVKAISRVVPTPYAEIVSTISSASAGPGTRQSIDEFTITTAKGIEVVGGAEKGKAIILLNPATPPMIMNNTIYARVDDVKEKEIIESVEKMVEDIQAYVPGYRLKIPPVFDGNKVTVMVEVEGSGDYLPKYSGNLDIETCAALAIGEQVAEHMLAMKGGV